jgi:hypothetical protein
LLLVYLLAWLHQETAGTIRAFYFAGFLNAPRSIGIGKAGRVACGTSDERSVTERRRGRGDVNLTNPPCRGNVETPVSWKRKGQWSLKMSFFRFVIPIVKSISTEFQTAISFEYLRGISTVLFSINVKAHVGNNSLGRRWMLQAGAVASACSAFAGEHRRSWGGCHRVAVAGFDCSAKRRPPPPPRAAVGRPRECRPASLLA